MKLKAIKSGLRTLGPALRKAPIPEVQRITGRRLQARRFRLWTANPHCECCGVLTDWPNGFELDHKVRLVDGGLDTEENCQILCMYLDDAGVKQGCHAMKTAEEASRQ